MSYEDPLWQLKMTLALSSKDWSENAADAWIYGIVVGWEDSEGSAVEELKRKFQWNRKQVALLRRLNRNFKAIAATQSTTTN